MTRQYCERCFYPVSTCVCDAIEIVHLPLSVVVIQHHKELSHAKNTLRLAKLVSPSIKVIDARDAQSISMLAQQASNNTVLLYPNPKSVSLEGFVENNNVAHDEIKQLILIDGTWKQAHGIWKRYKLEERINSVHFAKEIPQKYKIRTSKRNSQLSTIEALAYSLSLTTEVDVAPYYKILNAMQGFWLKY